MEKIQVDYTVTVSDFRKASYYGLFLRHRRPLQIMFAVLIGAVLYGAGSYLGVFSGGGLSLLGTSPVCRDGAEHPAVYADAGKLPGLHLHCNTGVPPGPV